MKSALIGSYTPKRARVCEIVRLSKKFPFFAPKSADFSSHEVIIALIFHHSLFLMNQLFMKRTKKDFHRLSCLKRIENKLIWSFYKREQTVAVFKTFISTSYRVLWIQREMFIFSPK